MKRLFALLLSYLVFATTLPVPAAAQFNRVPGPFTASLFANWSVRVSSGASSGAQTITMHQGFVALPDGRVIYPFATNAPISVGAGSNAETVTPSAVSGCSTQALDSCLVTATFSNAHGQGEPVSSGSFGLQEAINYAKLAGGGLVTVDSTFLGSSSTIAAAVPYWNVSIVDQRSGVPQNWNVTPASASFLAVPTALTAQAACDSTHTFCSDASVAGSWTSGTLYGCVAYVDIMGNEGPCSTTANFTTVVSKAVDVGAPAASTGAVGYTIYLSLIGGSYAFAYKVPLTSSICTLTTVETITSACAVTNATYGQTGSAAVVTAITVNTARLAPQVGAASSTTDYVPNSNARTSYAYVPGGRVGAPGVVSASLPFTVTTAAATTVPAVLASITLPAGFMNYVGRSIRICGEADEAANGSTSTITSLEFRWDADGSNAAGVPVSLGGPKITSTLVTANADNYSFCQDLTTTVAGASATAGSILAGHGWLSESYSSAGVAGVGSTGPTVGAAAVGSLNLAGEARIDIVYLHTTGTDAAGVTTRNITVEFLN